MTALSALAACILSGQVPDECVPSLVAETPGLAGELARLREERERRSAGMSSAASGEAGRGASISSPDGLRPADYFADILLKHYALIERMEANLDACRAALNSLDLPRQSPLPHRLGEQEGCCPVKRRSLLSKLIGSLHAPSFLQRLWRQ